MRCFKINIENWYFSCFVQKLLLEWGGGVIKQFMDNSCIYKINIPSLYSQNIGIKIFYSRSTTKYSVVINEFDDRKLIFKMSMKFATMEKKSLYFVFVKAFYFYEKLDNPVLCKDATHSFMIISDQYMPILCMMTLIYLSLSLIYHMDCDTFGSFHRM